MSRSRQKRFTKDAALLLGIEAAAFANELVRSELNLAQTGIRPIGLGALGYDARPEYNKTTAAKCRKMGMDILSCTPEKLAESMAHIIRG